MDEPRNDAHVFVDHARWLLEWHNKRSESITARSVSLLGFVGVVLALMFQGATLKIEPTRCTWLLVGLAVLTFTAAGLCSLRAIMTRSVSAPSVNQLRHWWAGHVAQPKAGTMHPQIAEALLNSLGAAGDTNLLGDAKRDADNRANLFKAAVTLTAIGLTALAMLLVNVLALSWK